MFNRILLVIIASTSLAITVYSQVSKKALTHDVYYEWKDLENPAISKNGLWVSYEVNPQKGDGVLFLVNAETNQKYEFLRGYRSKISPQSNFLVYRIKPQFEVTRKAKLDKKKTDELPKDSVGIVVFGTTSLKKYPNLISYKLPEEAGDWVTILTELSKKQTNADSTQNSGGSKTKKSISKKPKELGSLKIINPISGFELSIDSVNSYNISPTGNVIAYSRYKSDSVRIAELFLFNTVNLNSTKILSQQGEVEQLAFDRSGKQVAFVFTSDTGKVKVYSLFYWDEKTKQVQKVVDRTTPGIPKGYMVSQHFEPYFSPSGARLFLGTVKIPLEGPKDTLTDDEKVIIDLWSWTDTLLQTQQQVRLKENEKQSFLAVYHVKQKKLVQLANDSIPRISILMKGDAPFAIARCDKAYLYTMTWEHPLKSDYYILDLQTGSFEMVLKGNPFTPYLSPSGSYLAYYNPADSAWYSWDRKKKNHLRLTKKIPVNFFNESNDIPSIPNPYGFGGWVETENLFLIYDKYDIWAIDPTGKNEPQNLTNTRSNKITCRIIKTDDNDYLSSTNNELISIFNNINKKEGFAYINLKLKECSSPKVYTDHNYRFISKAKDAQNYIWQRESYNEYRDLWISNTSFTSLKKISDANPQMAEYKWGSVELFKWVDFNRDSVTGLLYKPEDFDPNKKYPMMVYFYETHSDNLHNHFEPKPSGSVICPTFYVSNDYLVFFPDIKYQIGYPGQSAYDAVISGTMALINHGFIDKDRIGVQGQSWGGYQVAYLVTQTNLFKAASAGAPVANMTSAYGGIRWGSGLARMFQYEHTQSRIGGTLWDNPLHYINNSPLFHAPRVNTPLLIRHDDADEAVPWYQGIEYFLALRRLGKPVWMINYNDEKHNLTRYANRVDWAIRMQQFFDYYLKDAPMPQWMRGIPQSQKGKTMGYELLNQNNE